MENSGIFATRLKELRGEMTQGKLGELLGVSRGSVSFYENEDRTPDAEFLIKASQHFNVSIDWLLGLSDYRNQDEIDGLLKRMNELDGLATKQKANLLWSLGFVSARAKHLNDEKLREDIIDWLSMLIQDYANMIYLPDELKLDALTHALMTQPHRNAINHLLNLEEAIAKEQYKRLFEKKAGETDAET